MPAPSPPPEPHGLPDPDEHRPEAEADDDLGADRQRRMLRVRRRNVLVGSAVLTACMALVVLDGLGAVDLVGVDQAEVADRAGGTTLTVRYPSVTRPGLASPFEITVEQEGGFAGGTVDVAVTSSYLLLWDLNGVVPAPSGERAEGDLVVWTFDVPEGEVLTVRYEARIEPARQHGGGARVAVLDADGAEVVGVDLHTDVRP